MHCNRPPGLEDAEIRFINDLRCLCTALAGIVSFSVLCSAADGLEPIPDKLVVLTFDDSAKSHYTTVRPILKRYGFGATFFITEGFDFPTNKTDYMTWEEIAELHRDGFEIGNHTGNHASITQGQRRQSRRADRGDQQAVRRRTEFPARRVSPIRATSILPEALPILKKAGIRFARRGGSPEYKYPDGRGFAYEPGLDHPLLGSLRGRCAARLDARRFHCRR